MWSVLQWEEERIGESVDYKAGEAKLVSCWIKSSFKQDFQYEVDHRMIKNYCSSLVTYSFFGELSLQINQLCSVEVPCDRLTSLQQFIIHQTLLIRSNRNPLTKFLVFNSYAFNFLAFKWIYVYGCLRTFWNRFLCPSQKNCEFTLRLTWIFCK